MCHCGRHHLDLGRSIAGVEMHDHVPMVLVLACLEDRVPALRVETLHDSTVGRPGG